MRKLTPPPFILGRRYSTAEIPNVPGFTLCLTGPSGELVTRATVHRHPTEGFHFLRNDKGEHLSPLNFTGWCITQ